MTVLTTFHGCAARWLKMSRSGGMFFSFFTMKKWQKSCIQPLPFKIFHFLYTRCFRTMTNSHQWLLSVFFSRCKLNKKCKPAESRCSRLSGKIHGERRLTVVWRGPESLHNRVARLDNNAGLWERPLSALLILCLNTAYSHTNLHLIELQNNQWNKVDVGECRAPAPLGPWREAVNQNKQQLLVFPPWLQMQWVRVRGGSTLFIFIHRQIYIKLNIPLSL